MRDLLENRVGDLTDTRVTDLDTVQLVQPGFDVPTYGE
jgi:hypothetical protein